MTVDTTKIASFFDTEYPLNKHGLQELLNLFSVQNIEKNTQVLLENTHEKQLRFLNKGTIREYYTAHDKETNINFYSKPQFITDLTSFINTTITKKNQETLTPVELLVIDKIPFTQLLEKYDCGKSFIDMSFQKLLKQKELFEYNRVTKSPEELYNELCIYKPHWLQNIPQYHIASYLNITPETLSRIRKRIS